YLPLPNFETVTSALNFSTSDCHIIGGCDLYTTKAAGGDKKLYKTIEHSLESQYESLLRLSASYSPPINSQKGADSSGGRMPSYALPDLNLSRSSPFGSLSQVGARRTFAYLIATLNASHPDYDFSHLLRPSDFRRERSLRSVMSVIDSTLQNLRPRTANPFLAVPHYWTSTDTPAGTTTLGVGKIWGPRMWKLIDEEMDLRSCSIYAYQPEEDPFDGEEGAIWSFHYFFFNKDLKRVCYLYLRGLSVVSHSPVRSTIPLRSLGIDRRGTAVSAGANKRASYWLGDTAEVEDVGGGQWGEDDEENHFTIDERMDDEVDNDEETLDDIRSELADGYNYSTTDEFDDEEEELRRVSSRSRSVPRAVSEVLADAMEI
ncbi:RNA polymerase III-inhibiting protein maf1, partial [Cryomyces antarcticus]